MKRTIEEKLLNPEPGSAAARARDFGIDLSLLIRQLRLTPEERLNELQQEIEALEEFTRQAKLARKKTFFLIKAMIKIESAIKAFSGNGVEYVVIGGVAIRAHSSAYVTFDIDICYFRSRENIKRLVDALAPYHPRPRDFPNELPFVWDEQTLKQGTNFTLTTELGDIDLLGEVTGLGNYEAVRSVAITILLYGFDCQVLLLDGLIKTKRAQDEQKIYWSCLNSKH